MPSSTAHSHGEASQPSTRLIPVALLDPPTSRARLTIPAAEIDELARSLSQVGQIQPLVVKATARGRFEVVAGERRLLAARLLKWPTLECRITSGTDDHLAAIQLTENVQRAAMNPCEEATALLRYMEINDATARDAARTLGKSDSWVNARIAVADLPDDVFALLAADAVGIGVALELGQITDPDYRSYLTDFAQTSGATTHVVRAWRQRWEEQSTNRPPNEVERPLDLQTPTLPVTYFECAGCGQAVESTQLRVLRVCPDMEAAYEMARRTRQCQCFQPQEQPEEQGDMDHAPTQPAAPAR